MRNIVIDLERLKYPNTGLYSFCKDLGRELINKNRWNLEFNIFEF